MDACRIIGSRKVQALTERGGKRSSRLPSRRRIGGMRPMSSVKQEKPDRGQSEHGAVRGTGRPSEGQDQILEGAAQGSQVAGSLSLESLNAKPP